MKNIEKKIDAEISESVKNALEAPEPPSEELKNIEKKIDAEISESVKNAIEAPEPPSGELTKYIWAED